MNKRKHFQIGEFQVLIKVDSYVIEELVRYYNFVVYDAEYKYSCGDFMKVGVPLSEWRNRFKDFKRIINNSLKREIVRTGGIIRLSQINGER